MLTHERENIDGLGITGIRAKIDQSAAMVVGYFLVVDIEDLVLSA